ncbi:MAG: DEAD/DEAH box helicase [Lachnospiraceae bacterium]|nr:DEAD/DEAH box helicase [Lachnospiraceae bacterium]
MRYDESPIDGRIIRAVTELGFENMTPIQEQAIPVLLEGRDVIGQAQTGTGKTAAFGIPLLQSIDPEDRSLQAVVLCPTRELAIQAAEEMRKFAKYMHSIKMVPIYGGQEMYRQINALKGGAQIVVGTPGRVMDHMRRHTLKMDTVKMVVLDEADEMLNMGFREDMELILKEMPAEHQTALFSATMPPAILEITGEYQKEDAVHVRVAAKELTVPLVKQYYFAVKNIYKEEVTCRLIDVYGLSRSIIFCNTKRMVDELADNLKKRGYQAEGLHGDLTQKQRDFVMGRFKSGNLQVLIATDVAARGIDVDDVEAVFNYDIPQDIEYYVHRIGRTGRAGREGVSFTFAYGRDMYRLREIEKVCKTRMTELRIPSASQVTRVKATKVLTQASVTSQTQVLDKIEDILEEYLVEQGEDPLRFAAALLKMHMGEDVQEIVVDPPKQRRDRSREEREGRSGRGERRRDGRREGRSDGKRDGHGGRGERKRDSRGGRDEGKRTHEGRGERDRRRGHDKDEKGSRIGRRKDGSDAKRSSRNAKIDSRAERSPKKKVLGRKPKDLRMDGSVK